MTIILMMAGPAILEVKNFKFNIWFSINKTLQVLLKAPSKLGRRDLVMHHLSRQPTKFSKQDSTNITRCRHLPQTHHQLAYSLRETPSTKRCMTNWRPRIFDQLMVLDRLTCLQVSKRVPLEQRLIRTLSLVKCEAGVLTTQPFSCGVTCRHPPGIKAPMQVKWARQQVWQLNLFQSQIQSVSSQASSHRETILHRCVAQSRKVRSGSLTY